jgi:hypothetical protein
MSKDYIKILIGDMNAKVGKDLITNIGNLNFVMKILKLGKDWLIAVTINLVISSTLFPHTKHTRKHGYI